MSVKKIVLRLLRFLVPTKRFLKDRLLALAIASCFAFVSGIHAYVGLGIMPVIVGALGFLFGWIHSLRLAIVAGVVGYAIVLAVSLSFPELGFIEYGMIAWLVMLFLLLAYPLYSHLKNLK